MSETASSRTKSVTGSGSSESTEEYVVPERWTNNIGYRELVISSCIGITQLWWHPYLFDLRKLIPFLFLYNMLSIFVSYPHFYLELAIGVVTKKGVLNCWDLSPIARGIGISMLLTCLLTALSLGLVCAWCLALLMHSWHLFLPWLHCAARATPPCAARHRTLAEGSEIPPQSFFFNFILNLKREGLQGGFGNIVWELSIYLVISWVLVYLIIVRRIYSYSKMVLFKDVLTYFVLICSLIGVANLNGAGAMFRMCDWSVLNDIQIWTDAIEYSLLQLTISQGSIIMLGSYCPKQKQQISSTAVISFLVSKLICMGSAITLGAVHGALLTDYDTNSTYLWNGTTTSLILWADYVARIPGSQFWSILVFFTLFVVALSTTALSVQTIMSTFTGKIIRKISWAFLIMLCNLLCFIGVMTLSTQGGMYILNFLMSWPVSKPRVFSAAATSIVVTYLYGQSSFCEDVFFAVEEYPCIFHRICWALSPLFLTVMFLCGVTGSTPAAAMGSILVSVMLLPIAIIVIVYCVFKCRVRNIVDNEK